MLHAFNVLSSVSWKEKIEKRESPCADVIAIQFARM